MLVHRFGRYSRVCPDGWYTHPRYRASIPPNRSIAQMDSGLVQATLATKHGMILPDISAVMSEHPAKANHDVPIDFHPFVSLLVVATPARIVTGKRMTQI